MLVSKYFNTIDEKNRMTIPAKYREELGYSCILTKGDDKCLYIYPMREWEKVLERLSALPTSDKDIRAYVRRVYTNAVECEIDKQGRILIPTELRDFAGIDKELVTAGMMQRIEVWSRAVWEAAQQQEEEACDADALSDKLKAYGV